MPPTTEWNLDFFARTTSGNSAKVFTSNLGLAIHPLHDNPVQSGLL